MTNDELRARFEAWASGNLLDLEWRAPIPPMLNEWHYADNRAMQLWLAWQACHAAMQGEDVLSDAERYRLIRKGMSEYHGDVYGMTFAEDGDYPVSGDALDKHVDAMGERHG